LGKVLADCGAGASALGPKPKTSKPGKGHAALQFDEYEVLTGSLRGGSGVSWHTCGLQYDRRSQFTSTAFTLRLAAEAFRISMDGRERYLDNNFIERLWRSPKHENVHLLGYAGGREARAGIRCWIGFHNGRCQHRVPKHRTPIAMWRSDRKIRRRRL
jgi:hypothetical protein